jgi:MFS family permease
LANKEKEIMPRIKNSNSLLIKATLLLASTLTVMAGATIAPSLPAMRTQFAEVEQVELLVRLVLTIPALFIVIGSPIAGWIVDRFGRKPLLIAAAVLYGLAGSSGFYLDSLAAILTGRALLGLSVAGVLVSATTLIGDYYVGAARATFLGLQAAFMGLGGVLFLTSGGYVADLDWRFPFLIYLFAWLLLPAMIFVLYEPDRATAANSGGAGGLAESSVNLTYLLILVFSVSTLTQIIFYLIPVQLPFYLRSLNVTSATQSGLAIAFSTLFSSFSSITYGRLKQRFDFVSILVLSFILMGAGYVVVGLANSYEQVLLGLPIAGLGLGLLMPNFNVWISKEVPDAFRGRALGGLTTFFFLGQFLSPIVSQPLSQQFGLAATYSLAGGALLFAAAVLFSLKRQVCALLTSSPIQS